MKINVYRGEQTLGSVSANQEKLLINGDQNFQQLIESYKRTGLSNSDFIVYLLGKLNSFIHAEVDNSERFNDRADAFPTYTKELTIQGVPIGITHKIGTYRTPDSKAQIADYGHIIGTSDRARHGKSADIYLGNEQGNTTLWRAEQLTDDGSFDQFKYFSHCRDKAHAKALHNYHVGPNRSGKIEQANWEDFRPKKFDADDDPYAVPRSAEDVDLPDADEVVEDWQQSTPEQYAGLIDAKEKDDTLFSGIAATILLAAWLWDASRGRYLKPATRQNPKRAAMTPEELEQVVRGRIEQSKQRFDRLSSRLASDRIGLNDWFNQAWSEVENLHTQAYALGRGGIEQMKEGDRALLKRLLRFQKFRLSEFQSDLIAETISDAQAENRLRMYADSALNSFKLGVHQGAIASGKTKGWRKLSPTVKEHCRDCPGYTTNGYVDINKIVVPGTLCECGPVGCQCLVVYR